MPCAGSVEGQGWEKKALSRVDRKLAFLLRVGSPLGSVVKFVLEE